MNTRHLATIKSSELRHHYFHELGATKLACVWVLEHGGTTRRRDRSPGTAPHGPLPDQDAGLPGSAGRYRAAPRLVAVPPGGGCGPGFWGPHHSRDPRSPGEWHGPCAGMAGLPGRSWAAPRLFPAPRRGYSPGV